MRIINNNKLLIRIISILLVGVFSVQEISHAAVGISADTSIFSKQNLSTVVALESFKAPLNFCSMHEFHVGNDQKPLIILIQDPHSNLSGQENLSATLDSLITEYKINTVFVEGASKEATLDPIKEMVSDKKLLKRVARNFLIQGELSGEEYLNLTSDHPMKIYGVEDKKLYLKSVDNYALLATQREEAIAYLTQIQASLTKLKSKLYPKPLLKYESDTKSPDSDKLESLLALSETSKMDLANYPNLEKIKILKLRENQIDFTLANLEQAKLIESLGQEHLDELLKTYNQSKNSKASLLSYFQNIFNKAKQKNINVNQYSNVLAYVNYLKQFEQVDIDTLLEEQQNLEDQVYLQMLKELGKDTPKKSSAQDGSLLVRSIDRYLRLLQTAYKIQMTTKEFMVFQANEKDFSTKAYLAFLNTQLAENGYFSELIVLKDTLEKAKDALYQFYDSVNQRDLAFMENMKRMMPAEKSAFLITGGYHTQHLKELFQQEEYSYVVLSPIVTQETNQAKYEKLLLEPLGKYSKKVQVTQGMSKAASKSLSALDKDLQRPKAVTKEGVRTEGMAEGSRLPGLAKALDLNSDEVSKIFGARVVNSSLLKVEDAPNQMAILEASIPKNTLNSSPFSVRDSERAVDGSRVASTWTLVIRERLEESTQGLAKPESFNLNIEKFARLEQLIQNTFSKKPYQDLTFTELQELKEQLELFDQTRIFLDSLENFFAGKTGSGRFPERVKALKDILQQADLDIPLGLRRYKIFAKKDFENVVANVVSASGKDSTGKILEDESDNSPRLARIYIERLNGLINDRTDSQLDELVRIMIEAGLPDTTIGHDGIQATDTRLEEEIRDVRNYIHLQNVANRVVPGDLVEFKTGQDKRYVSKVADGQVTSFRSGRQATVALFRLGFRTSREDKNNLRTGKIVTLKDGRKIAITGVQPRDILRGKLTSSVTFLDVSDEKTSPRSEFEKSIKPIKLSVLKDFDENGNLIFKLSDYRFESTNYANKEKGYVIKATHIRNGQVYFLKLPGLETAGRIDYEAEFLEKAIEKARAEDPENELKEILPQSQDGYLTLNQAQALFVTSGIIPEDNSLRDVSEKTEDKRLRYLVTKQMPGINLQERIDQLASSGQDETANVLNDIVLLTKAISTLHRSGIYNRDIKPIDIFIENAGTPEAKIRILDFELSIMPDVEGFKLNDIIEKLPDAWNMGNTFSRANNDDADARDLTSILNIGFEYVQLLPRNSAREEINSLLKAAYYYTGAADGSPVYAIQRLPNAEGLKVRAKSDDILSVDILLDAFEKLQAKYVKAAGSRSVAGAKLVQGNDVSSTLKDIQNNVKPQLELTSEESLSHFSRLTKINLEKALDSVFLAEEFKPHKDEILNTLRKIITELFEADSPEYKRLLKMLPRLSIVNANKSTISGRATYGTFNTIYLPEYVFENGFDGGTLAHEFGHFISDVLNIKDPYKIFGTFTEELFDMENHWSLHLFDGTPWHSSAREGWKFAVEYLDGMHEEKDVKREVIERRSFGRDALNRNAVFVGTEDYASGGFMAGFLYALNGYDKQATMKSMSRGWFGPLFNSLSILIAVKMASFIGLAIGLVLSSNYILSCTPALQILLGVAATAGFWILNKTFLKVQNGLIKRYIELSASLKSQNLQPVKDENMDQLIRDGRLVAGFIAGGYTPESLKEALENGYLDTYLENIEIFKGIPKNEYQNAKKALLRVFEERYSADAISGSRQAASGLGLRDAIKFFEQQGLPTDVVLTKALNDRGIEYRTFKRGALAPYINYDYLGLTKPPARIYELLQQLEKQQILLVPENILKPPYLSRIVFAGSEPDNVAARYAGDKNYYTYDSVNRRGSLGSGIDIPDYLLFNGYGIDALSLLFFHETGEMMSAILKLEKARVDDYKRIDSLRRELRKLCEAIGFDEATQLFHSLGIILTPNRNIFILESSDNPFLDDLGDFMGDLNAVYVMRGESLNKQIELIENERIRAKVKEAFDFLREKFYDGKTVTADQIKPLLEAHKPLAEFYEYAVKLQKFLRANSDYASWAKEFLGWRNWSAKRSREKILQIDNEFLDRVAYRETQTDSRSAVRRALSHYYAVLEALKQGNSQRANSLLQKIEKTKLPHLELFRDHLKVVHGVSINVALAGSRQASSQNQIPTIDWQETVGYLKKPIVDTSDADQFMASEQFVAKAKFLVGVYNALSQRVDELIKLQNNIAYIQDNKLQHSDDINEIHDIQSLDRLIRDGIEFVSPDGADSNLKGPTAFEVLKQRIAAFLDAYETRQLDTRTLEADRKDESQYQTLKELVGQLYMITNGQVLNAEGELTDLENRWNKEIFGGFASPGEEIKPAETSQIDWERKQFNERLDDMKREVGEVEYKFRIARDLVSDLDVNASAFKVYAAKNAVHSAKTSFRALLESRRHPILISSIIINAEKWWHPYLGRIVLWGSYFDDWYHIGKYESYVYWIDTFSTLLSIGASLDRFSSKIDGLEKRFGKQLDEDVVVSGVRLAANQEPPISRDEVLFWLADMAKEFSAKSPRADQTISDYVSETYALYPLALEILTYRTISTNKFLNNAAALLKDHAKKTAPFLMENEISLLARLPERMKSAADEPAISKLQAELRIKIIRDRLVVIDRKSSKLFPELSNLRDLVRGLKNVNEHPTLRRVTLFRQLNPLLLTANVRSAVDFFNATYKEDPQIAAELFSEVVKSLYSREEFMERSVTLYVADFQNIDFVSAEQQRLALSQTVIGIAEQLKLGEAASIVSEKLLDRLKKYSQEDSQDLISNLEIASASLFWASTVLDGLDTYEEWDNVRAKKAITDSFYKASQAISAMLKANVIENTQLTQIDRNLQLIAESLERDQDLFGDIPEEIKNRLTGDSGYIAQTRGFIGKYLNGSVDGNAGVRLAGRNFIQEFSIGGSSITFSLDDNGQLTISVTAKNGAVTSSKVPKDISSIQLKRINGFGGLFANNLGVSGNKHAEVFREGDQWFIRDLGSTNGTLVNGKRITEKTLIKFEVKQVDTKTDAQKVREEIDAQIRNREYDASDVLGALKSIFKSIRDNEIQRQPSTEDAVVGAVIVRPKLEKILSGKYDLVGGLIEYYEAIERRNTAAKLEERIQKHEDALDVFFKQQPQTSSQAPPVVTGDSDIIVSNMIAEYRKPQTGSKTITPELARRIRDILIWYEPSEIHELTEELDRIRLFAENAARKNEAEYQTRLNDLIDRSTDLSYLADHVREYLELQRYDSQTRYDVEFPKLVRALIAFKKAGYVNQESAISELNSKSNLGLSTQELKEFLTLDRSRLEPNVLTQLVSQSKNAAKLGTAVGLFYDEQTQKQVEFILGRLTIHEVAEINLPTLGVVTVDIQGFSKGEAAVLINSTTPLKIRRKDLSRLIAEYKAQHPAPSQALALVSTNLPTASSRFQSFKYDPYRQELPTDTRIPVYLSDNSELRVFKPFSSKSYKIELRKYGTSEFREVGSIDFNNTAFSDSTILLLDRASYQTAENSGRVTRFSADQPARILGIPVQRVDHPSPISILFHVRAINPVLHIQNIGLSDIWYPTDLNDSYAQSIRLNGDIQYIITTVADTLLKAGAKDADPVNVESLRLLQDIQNDYDAVTGQWRENIVPVAHKSLLNDEVLSQIAGRVLQNANLRELIEYFRAHQGDSEVKPVAERPGLFKTVKKLFGGARVAVTKLSPSDEGLLRYLDKKSKKESRSLFNTERVILYTGNLESDDVQKFEDEQLNLPIQVLQKLIAGGIVTALEVKEDESTSYEFFMPDDDLARFQDDLKEDLIKSFEEAISTFSSQQLIAINTAVLGIKYSEVDGTYQGDESLKTYSESIGQGVMVQKIVEAQSRRKTQDEETLRQINDQLTNLESLSARQRLDFVNKYTAEVFNKIGNTKSWYEFYKKISDKYRDEGLKSFARNVILVYLNNHYDLISPANLEPENKAKKVVSILTESPEPLELSQLRDTLTLFVQSSDVGSGFQRGELSVGERAMIEGLEDFVKDSSSGASSVSTIISLSNNSLQPPTATSVSTVGVRLVENKPTAQFAVAFGVRLSVAELTKTNIASIPESALNLLARALNSGALSEGTIPIYASADGAKEQQIALVGEVKGRNDVVKLIFGEDEAVILPLSDQLQIIRGLPVTTAAPVLNVDISKEIQSSQSLSLFAEARKVFQFSNSAVKSLQTVENHTFVIVASKEAAINTEFSQKLLEVGKSVGSLTGKNIEVVITYYENGQLLDSKGTEIVQVEGRKYTVFGNAVNKDLRDRVLKLKNAGLFSTADVKISPDNKSIDSSNYLSAFVTAAFWAGIDKTKLDGTINNNQARVIQIFKTLYPNTDIQVLEQASRRILADLVLYEKKDDSEENKHFAQWTLPKITKLLLENIVQGGRLLARTIGASA